MSESVFIQIRNEMGEEKAQEIIKEMKRDPHQEALQGALTLFNWLEACQAEEILRKHNFCIEAAFEELETENNCAEEHKKRQRQLEEKNKKEQESNQYIEIFAKHFKSLSKEEITKVFAECGRDPKRTSQALVELLRQRERENEESQRLRRELEINNLVRIYAGIYEELEISHILRVIRENELDDERINKVLDAANKQKLFEDLYLQFCEKLTGLEIQQALRESEWKKMDAARMCLVKAMEKQKERELSEEREEREERRERAERRVIPQLELDEGDWREVEQHSVTYTLLQVQKMRKQEEERHEKETLQLIERNLIEHLEPLGSSSSLALSGGLQEGGLAQPKEGDKDSEGNLLCHSITVTEAEGKLHAKAKVIGENSYSWIGFYKKGEADNKYITYNYVCNLKDKTLVVDKPALNGEYEFRSFLSKYQIACKSESITIERSDKLVLRVVDEKTVTVTWRVGSFDPYQSRAYVTIHKVEEQRPNYYRRWCWMETPKGSYSFKKPIHSGVYEARVYIGNELKFRSGTIEVQGI